MSKYYDMPEKPPAPTQILSRTNKLSDRFDVIKIIGKGTAGVVYRVKDRHRAGKEVALKVLADKMAFDEHTILRFHDELEVCRKLNHPNLVQAFDLIEFEDSIAFTMEFVKGCDLGQMLSENKFSYEEIDKIMYQLLDGLKALHSIKVVHRDIKLENILLRDDGKVKLSDLGLLKDLTSKGMTKPGILLGTAQYMPPEYIKLAKFNERSDIYACGVVLYELLTGVRRLGDRPGGAAIEYLLKTNFEFPKINLPAEHRKYASILAKALALNPEKRFKDADQMQAAFFPEKNPQHGSYNVRDRVSFGGGRSKVSRKKVRVLAFFFLVLTFLVSFMSAVLLLTKMGARL